MEHDEIMNDRRLKRGGERIERAENERAGNERLTDISSGPRSVTSRCSVADYSSRSTHGTKPSRGPVRTPVTLTSHPSPAKGRRNIPNKTEVLEILKGNIPRRFGYRAMPLIDIPLH